MRVYGIRDEIEIMKGKNEITKFLSVPDRLAVLISIFYLFYTHFYQLVY